MTDLLHGRVRVDVDGWVARITLARPDAGNGLDLAMARGIRDAARQVEKAVAGGQARVLVVTAEGAMFCVGGDLREIAAAPDRGTLMGEIADAVHEAIRCFATIPVPVVTVVSGAVAGGGIGVALAGDIVLASSAAKFTMAYTAAGLSPDCGTSWQLARRLGTARALDLALTNRRITAAEAAEWGLISRVVDAEALQQETEKLVALLAGGSRTALAEAKRLVRAAESIELDPHLDDEARAITTLVAGADGREGVDAFLGKRPPAFTRHG